MLNNLTANMVLMLSLFAVAVCDRLLNAGIDCFITRRVVVTLTALHYIYNHTLQYLPTQGAAVMM